MKKDLLGAKHFREAVSRWLGGGHNFTLYTLARISVVLGVPLISVAK